MSIQPNSRKNDIVITTAQTQNRKTEPSMLISRLLSGESSSSKKTPTSTKDPFITPKSEPAEYPNWETFLADLGRSFDKTSAFHPPADHLVRIEPVTGRITATDSVFLPSALTPTTSTSESTVVKEEPISTSPSPVPEQLSISDNQPSSTASSDSSTESSSSSENVKQESASTGTDSSSPTPDSKDPNLFPWNPFVLTDVAQEVTIETTYPKTESPTPIELDDALNCQAIFNREHSNQTTAEISRRFMEFICGTSKSMKFFAEAIVGVAETTLYSYLKNPAPWEQLKGKKKSYWRMANWLELKPVDQAAIMEMSVEEAASITRVKRQRKRREPATPRIVLTKLQKERLTQAVRVTPNSTWPDMEKLAEEIGLEAKQVKNFFKNNKHRF